MEREKVEVLTDIIFLGCKFTADSDNSHEIRILLGRKTLTNLDSLLKSRGIPLLTHFWIDKATVFLLVMYKWESWTIKKAACRNINAFQLGCWRRLLRVLWTARRSNQLILKAINTEYSLERLMLKLQHLGHLMQRADSLEKDSWCWERLRARGEGGKRGWMVGWHYWHDGHEFQQTLEDGGEQRSLVCCSPWGHSPLNDWIATTETISIH